MDQAGRPPGRPASPFSDAMRASSATRAIATGFVLVVFAICWRLIGPAQLGGTASYVITHGISMEPEYYEGDLVILRRADSYGKGDIVGYQSPTLDRTVLHRIHSRDSRGFVTKGDNNAWLDLDRPRSADVIGEAWLHIPGAGKWLAKAGSPAGATLLITLVTLTFFTGTAKKKRRARTGKGPQVQRIAFSSFTERQKMILGGCGAAVLLMGALAVFSFAQPLAAAVASGAAYEHEGDLSYSATVKKSPVYPSGKVTPDGPVFLRLVDELEVAFDYRLKADVEHEVTGDAAIIAKVIGASGWSKTFPIATQQGFKGDAVTVKGTFDFSTVQGISSRVQNMTGVTELGQTIAFVPRVSVEGTMAGERFTDSFDREIVFQMDALKFQLKPDGGDAAAPAADPLHVSAPGNVSLSETRANKLQLPGLSLDIRSARTAGLLGLLLSVLALTACWRHFSNPAHADEWSLIEAQYGDWLIPVESMRAQSQHKAVQVKSMEALVRLAELYERMILHETSEGIHSYFVEEEGVVYYYQALGDQKRHVDAPASATAGPRFSGRRLREQQRRDEVARLREELTAIETEVLREKAGPPDE